MLLLSVILLLAQSLSPEAIEHAQAGAAAQQQGQFDTAIAEFRKVIALQPNLATGYANLGDAYFRKGNYDEAVAELQHALRINDNLPVTHQILGTVLLLEGDALQALPHLQKAPIPQLLGLAYLELGEAASAVYALQTALNLTPDDLDVLYYYGRATDLASRQALDHLRQTGRESTAAKEAADGGAPRTAHIPDLIAPLTELAKKPGDPDLLAQFAHTAAAASAQAFDRIAAVKPDSARAHQVAAERYEAQGQTQRAVQEYGASLRIAPATGGVHLALGNLLASAGDAADAVREFHAESALRPASADAFYYAGSILLQEGKGGEALTDLTRADQLRPDTAQILLALGRAASLTGDSARAAKAFQRVIELNPTGKYFTEAHAALADNDKPKGTAKP